MQTICTVKSASTVELDIYIFTCRIIEPGDILNHFLILTEADQLPPFALQGEALPFFFHAIYVTNAILQMYYLLIDDHVPINMSFLIHSHLMLKDRHFVETSVNTLDDTCIHVP